MFSVFKAIQPSNEKRVRLDVFGFLFYVHTHTHTCAHTDVLSCFLSLSMFKTGLAWSRCSSNDRRKEGGTDNRASVKEASCFRERTLASPRSGSAGSSRGEVQWEMMRDGAGESGTNQVKQDHRTQGKRWEL